VTFLLDTNVLSEWTKPRPNSGVVAWLADIDEDRVFISVVTFAELRHGIERMAPGAHRKRLDEWLRDELPQRFEARILPVDGAVADAWGKDSSASRKRWRAHPRHGCLHRGDRRGSWTRPRYPQFVGLRGLAKGNR
jgi:predicted nucleic acid-binding protein